MDTAIETTLKDTLTELLGKSEQEIALLPAVAARRNASLEKLAQLSVPNVRNEDWKYSDMERILQDFRFVAPAQENDFEIEISNQNCIHIHNGRATKVELTPEANELVTIIPVRDAMQQFPELMEKYYGSKISSADFFSHLNMAYSNTGILLYVKENATVNDPIFMYQDCYDEKEMFVQSHNLVVIGKNASVTVIKKQVCSGDGARVFHNLWSEIILEEGAKFSFNRLQNECKDTYQVTYISAALQKDAQLNLTNIAIGGSFTRNSFWVDLDGTHSNAKLTGLTILNEKQHSDAWVNIRHNQPECESDQLFKSIVNDESTSAFSGKIYVARDAQKTNAYQSNKNIVLTETANAYSRPQLEIYADDVKCSHGSTTGQIDDDALFYLRARGMKESTARKLLLYAFAENIVERLDEANFQEEVHDMIHQKFN
jgi:Fe-S cluster assembly protein SufD